MTSRPDTDRTIPGGLLVAFEGADGTGKTTQARMAVATLRERGFDAVYLREPTDGPHGRRLRQLMVAGRETLAPLEEFRLFLEDRREDVEQNIRPALARGAIVCIDRYYISSMAYQGALGLDPAMIRAENEKFAPIPDLVLLFTLPLDEARKRIEATRQGGANLFEARAYQERVAAILTALDLPHAFRVEATDDIQDVHAAVLDRIFAEARVRLETDTV